MLSTKGQACKWASVCVCVSEGGEGVYYKWDLSFLGHKDGNNFSHAFTVIWIVLLKQIWLHISFERYSNWLCFKLPSNTGLLCSLAQLITGPWSSSLTGCGRTLSTSFFFSQSFSPHWMYLWLHRYMSFVLSFQFHSMCLALRDLYSGLAIMIRMPQSKPCEFLQWQVKEREREKKLPVLPFSPSFSVFLSLTHTHTGNMNQIFMKWAEVLIHPYASSFKQLAVDRGIHPACMTQPRMTESMTTPLRHLSPLLPLSR